MKLRFGPQLPTYGRFASMQAITEAAREAESSGYHAVFMEDHIERNMDNHLYHSSIGYCEEGMDPGEPGIYETLTTAGYLSAATSSVEIGIMILLLPQRDPIVTAKQIATVDQLSRGRLLIGLGVGNESHRSELEIMGVPYAERGKIAEDYIRAMKEIWTKPISSYQGRYINFEGASIFPKPYTKPHPPLIIAGAYHLQPRIIRRIAELGDGWVPILTPEEIKKGLELVRQTGSTMGKANKQYKVVAYEFTSIAATTEDAVKRYNRGFHGQKLMHERHDTARIPPEEFRARSLVGSPDDIIRRLEEYARVGVTHVEMLFSCSTMEELMDQQSLFAKEVLPSFG